MKSVAYSKKYRKNKKRGIDYAIRHVEEAKALSRELGGNDKDVKDWFFSKSKSELQRVFSSYRTRYGDKAADYAEDAFPEWKARRRQMSGLVASRLFSLLPSFMPIEDKYKLVESLWNHVGPKRKRLISAGLQADKEAIISEVKKEVELITTQWTIPPELSQRFSWLAGDDSEVYQLLLSHIKRHEMDLRERTLLSHLPELSAKFADNLGDAHETFSYIIGVGHQSVEVRLNGDSTDIFTGDWREKTFASYSQTSNYQKKTESFESLWILVCVIWVLVMIFSALD